MKNIFILLNIAILLFSCSNNEMNKQVETNNIPENSIVLTPEQLKNAEIETAKINKINISSILKVNGKVDVPPQSMVSISVPMGGYLKFTKLLAGTHVNKGDLLAVIEDAQYIQLQQDYLTTKAHLALSESEYQRQKELNQSKASSDKVYEQAKSNYQTQLITVKSLEEKLKLIGINPQKLTSEKISNSINIYSPITGFVSHVNVNIGKYINPSDVLFELIDPSDIHLSLSVFEKDINKLFIGQKLIAYTNTHPGKTYPCEIILVSKNLSAQSSAEVHCHFEQYDKSLLPGMFMNAEIELKGNNSTVLPTDAIVRYQNAQYVFRSVGNNQFQMLEVSTGNSENGYTEVAIPDSLSNTLFVSKGAYNLLMALKNRSDE